MENDCECEDTPILTYCKKCKRIYVVNKDGERIEILKQDA